MKVLGKIDVDLDVVNKEYVDKLKNNLNNYVPLATYEDFTKTNDSRYNDFLKKIESKADKDHTHDEYLKKGEPITLTATQKAELKGDRGDRGADGTSITTWTGTESQYNALYTKSSTTLYVITG